MELPIELQGILLLLVGMFVTFLLTQLAKLGFDFSGYESRLVAALFSAVLVVVNAVLEKVPADMTGYVGLILQLLVVVLGSFGVHGLYKSVKK